jgi:Protein of unknown function (DUF3833)
MKPALLVTMLVGSLSTAACSEPVPAPAANAPDLDPIAFFTGTAEGQATLKTVMSAGQSVRVHSEGRSDGHGGLILVQHIVEGTKPERVRTWTMQPVEPGRFTGTLVPDAIGPVSITIEGARADIAYRMKSGMTVAQTLVLQPDARTIANRLLVKKWGIRVAELDETIRKTR